ncbi:metal-sulfur cluster assembly factor [Pseudorhizobium marinum]|uniref:metal-sulfur cluster assembly factor n=1 Tax=Pseudorhizobium marinum TaxID=1496690 RepID=UPI00049855D5|nr:metal-sulfur cluster assembly factor [Pseudorhizobium marinum]
MSSKAATLVERIRTRLKDVIDPELGRDVVSLGLIYEVDATDAGVVHISMTTTTIGCPAAVFLVGAVRFATASVTDVQHVEVHLTHEPRWTPEMMSV